MSDRIEGERTVSAVSGTKRSWMTKNRAAMLIGGTAIGAIGLVFWINPGAKKPEEKPAAPPKGIERVVRYDPPKPVAMPALPVANTLPPPRIDPPPVERPPPPPPPKPLEERVRDIIPQSAPVKAAGTGRMVSYATTPPKAAGGAGGLSDAPGRSDGTNVAFKGTEIPGAKAGPAIDQTLVLMPGLIQCVLDTAIDTTLPGDLLCHLPAPVISRGGVKLMEKDSMIIGSYQADPKAGQNRIMAASAVGYTPRGVPVPLGGNFADSLGRTGLDGDVDNHYLQRFGGALGLSFAESLLSIVQASVSKSGNSYISFSSGGGVGSLARDILRSTVNIPPTIRKNQGEMITLWIKQPIDFSPAYQLKER